MFGSRKRVRPGEQMQDHDTSLASSSTDVPKTVGSALAGASAGALVGSLAGPVTAVVGALVGALVNAGASVQSQRNAAERHKQAQHEV